jgi:hypothetical protein
LIYLCGKSTAILYDTDDKRKTCARPKANELVRFAEVQPSLFKTGSAEEEGGAIECYRESREQS